MLKHRKIREGDEFYCVFCEARWPVLEEEPPCLPSITVPERGLKNKWVLKIPKGDLLFFESKFDADCEYERLKNGKDFWTA